METAYVNKLTSGSLHYERPLHHLHGPDHRVTLRLPLFKDSTRQVWAVHTMRYSGQHPSFASRQRAERFKVGIDGDI